MKTAAQIAMVSIPLSFAAALKDPTMFLGLLQLLYGVAGWVIAWYVLFTLPGEIVDRYADRRAAMPATVASIQDDPGSLGGYPIHHAQP